LPIGPGTDLGDVQCAGLHLFQALDLAAKLLVRENRQLHFAAGEFLGAALELLKPQMDRVAGGKRVGDFQDADTGFHLISGAPDPGEPTARNEDS
jgi:hypothetical protein